MNKNKFKFESFQFLNRWKIKHPNSDWTILGFSWWWAGYSDKRFGIHFFGLDILIWFKR